MTVQYQGVWSLQSAAQLQSTQRWVTDPLFKNTTLLLQADDAANGAQNNTFLDSSSNNFAITRNGNTTQGSFTPFSSQPGAWSNYFNGATTSGPLVFVTYSTTNFDWFTAGQDFTLECWVYPVDLATFSYSDGINTVPRMTGNNDQNGTTNFWSFGPIADGRVRLHYFNGAVVQVTSTAVVIPNAWNHIAFTKTSSGITFFVNGVASTTTAVSGTPQSSGTYPLTIGRGNSGSINGYVSNYRILKNVTPPYSGSYTVPIAPFTDVSGTRILTAQANRFVDASSTANTISTTGATVSVQPFSPFAPQFQWTPSVIGGSGYFDGTGDWLTLPSNNAFNNLSGTTFTLEFWMYPTAYAAGTGFNESRTVFSTAGVFPNGFRIDLTTTSIVWYDYVGSTRTSFAVPINAWTHVAFTYSSNTLNMYVNGVSRATSSSATWNNSSTIALVGALNSGSYIYPYQGYLQSLRLVNAVVYTGTFTPPSAPLSTSGAGSASAYPSTTNVNTSFAASATSLLLNFTNAGIYDGTMKNNLETVGNAQISTAVVKYGSGSIFINGASNYLIAPLSPISEFGTEDFTVEFWMNASAVGTYVAVVGTQSIAGSGTAGMWRVVNRFNSANGLYFAYTTGSGFVDLTFSTANYNDGTWRHIAVTRASNNLRAFVNGVQVGSTTSITQSLTSGQRLNVGWNAQDGQFYTGYIDDLRITKGIARYTQNFIPPSVALPRQ